MTVSNIIFPLRGSTRPMADTFYAPVSESFKTLTSFLCPRNLPNEQIEVILLMGSDFEETAIVGAELAGRLKPNAVVCSGGRGRLTPPEWKTEAERYAKILLERLEHPPRILVENQSTNGGENIAWSLRLLKSERLTPSSFVVLQYPPLQLRAEATLRQHLSGQGQIYSYAPFIPDFDSPLSNWELAEWRRRMAWDLAGEVVRIVAYQRHPRNFITPVEVPPDILTATETIYQLLFQDPTIPSEFKAGIKQLLAEVEWTF